jgi:hypothetical protein
MDPENIAFSVVLPKFARGREQQKEKNESFSLFQVGCGVCSLRAAPFCLRPHVFLRVSSRPLVGPGVHGTGLFRECVLEY